MEFFTASSHPTKLRKNVGSRPSSPSIDASLPTTLETLFLTVQDTILFLNAIDSRWLPDSELEVFVKSKH